MPWTMDHFRNHTTQETNTTTPTRMSQVPAMANSRDTPLGRNSSPTSTHDQMRPRMTRASFSQADCGTSRGMVESWKDGSLKAGTLGVWVAAVLDTAAPGA